jgi:hypothetical protein
MGAFLKASRITWLVNSPKADEAIRFMPYAGSVLPCLSKWQSAGVWACHSGAEIGWRKAMIFMEAWHLGHLKTGLGRSAQASIKTCKIN